MPTPGRHLIILVVLAIVRIRTPVAAIVLRFVLNVHKPNGFMSAPKNFCEERRGVSSKLKDDMVAMLYAKLRPSRRKAGVYTREKVRTWGVYASTGCREWDQTLRMPVKMPRQKASSRHIKRCATAHTDIQHCSSLKAIPLSSVHARRNDTFTSLCVSHDDDQIAPDTPRTYAALRITTSAVMLPNLDWNTCSTPSHLVSVGGTRATPANLTGRNTIPSFLLVFVFRI